MCVFLVIVVCEGDLGPYIHTRIGRVGFERKDVVFHNVVMIVSVPNAETPYDNIEGTNSPGYTKVTGTQNVMRRLSSSSCSSGLSEKP